MKNSLLLLLAFCSVDCVAQIKVKFNNQTDKTIVVNISYGEMNSPTESYQVAYTATVTPNSQSPDFVKVGDVKKNKKFIVIGSVQGMGNFKYLEASVSSRNQEFTIPLTINGITVPSDNVSYQSLLAQLNFDPPKNSSKPMDAGVAFKTYFGGLSLRKNALEIDHIEPTVLKAEVSPVQFGSYTNTVSIYLSGNFMTTNKASVPAIASVGADVSSDKLYKLTYTVDDIGPVVWTPPNGKSITQLFKEMDEITKTGLIKRYLADTSLKLYQYDHIYCYKNLSLQINSYVKSSTAIDVSVPVFFSDNTTFKKDDENAYTVNSTTYVLNIWPEKDVTYLLSQAATDYLTDKAKLVQESTTTKDAQAVIKQSLTVDSKSLIASPDNATKSEISNHLHDAIKSLTTKTLTLQAL